MKKSTIFTSFLLTALVALPLMASSASAQDMTVDSALSHAIERAHVNANSRAITLTLDLPGGTGTPPPPDNGPPDTTPVITPSPATGHWIEVVTNQDVSNVGLQWETSGDAVNWVNDGPVPANTPTYIRMAGGTSTAYVGAVPVNGNLLGNEANPYITKVMAWADGLTGLNYVVFCNSVSVACLNNFTVPDALPPSVTNLSHMFVNNVHFNQPIASWDVSNVTDMEGMFLQDTDFNQPVGNWDVSNVTNMDSMFNNAWYFNQPIGNWNVSNVTNMASMFLNAAKFDQPIGGWNVSNVTNMANMFSGSGVFDQPLNDWNVSNVTDMSWMFDNAQNFNQPLNNWDVSNVRNMSHMFMNAVPFNQPLDDWDVSKVTNMGSMFWGLEEFNQNLSGWCVGNVTDYTGFASTKGWVLPHPDFDNPPC